MVMQRHTKHGSTSTSRNHPHSRNQNEISITIDTIRHKDKYATANECNQFVCGNVCPLCLVTLSDRRTTIQHVRRTRDRMRTKLINHCITRCLNKGAPHTIKMDDEFHCKECDTFHQGKDDILLHCRKHLRHIIFQEEITKSPRSSQKQIDKLFQPSQEKRKTDNINSLEN